MGGSEMIQKITQYKNLVLVVAAVILTVTFIASDPLGFCARRAHERAAIHNQMAIEKAEAEKQIAIIKAQTDAELKRLEQGEDLGLEVTGDVPQEEVEETADTAANTSGEEKQ